VNQIHQTTVPKDLALLRLPLPECSKGVCYVSLQQDLLAQKPRLLRSMAVFMLPSEVVEWLRRHVSQLRQLQSAEISLARAQLRKRVAWFSRLLVSATSMARKDSSTNCLQCQRWSPSVLCWSRKMHYSGRSSVTVGNANNEIP